MFYLKKQADLEDARKALGKCLAKLVVLNRPIEIRNSSTADVSADGLNMVLTATWFERSEVVAIGAAVDDLSTRAMGTSRSRHRKHSPPKVQQEAHWITGRMTIMELPIW